MQMSSMELDDSRPATLQERQSDRVPTQVPVEGAQDRSLEEHAALTSASATPLPPSSPPEISQVIPQSRIKVSGPCHSFQIHSPSRPHKPDRRSSTSLQASSRTPSSSYTPRSNATMLPPTSRQVSSSISPSSPSTPNSRSSFTAQAADPSTSHTLTAESLATGQFQKELDAHNAEGNSSRTMVIVRDSCYGHRYSRPRTSKSTLSTIVERPERMHACILGASIAYVRLGGRHTGSQFPPRLDMELPPVPFRLQKTTRSMPLNYPAVTQVHGQKWMEELQVMCDSAEGKLAINGRELVRPVGYGKDEAGKPLPKLHDGDLYLCSESLDALQGCLGGVCEAVDNVFRPGKTRRAFVCIRPPGHHCSANFPAGFCWLNNVHVGIAHAAMDHDLTHAAIIDFDLHHGDGSQTIAWEHNRRAAGNLPKNASPYSKAPIGYFSLHDINSYPCEWGDDEKIKNASLCVEDAHGQSVWNVHLEPWKSHTEFWGLYETRYRILMDKTRAFLRRHTERLNKANHGPKPKAAIFLSAGFDASEWEGAGMQRHKVNVPTDFYARFTSDVVKVAEEAGLGVEGRIISVLEGGYSDRALMSGTLSHLCGLACDSVQPGQHAAETVDGDLASAVAQSISMLKLNADEEDEKRTGRGTSPTPMSYDPEWWTNLHLEAVETLVNPASATPSKTKDKSTANYSSPTQASTAKMVDPVRERRSLSGQLGSKMSTEPEPVQPSPDVDWTLASHSLSRLLIPTDRQTLSCRHDELNAEATKVRRERQSVIGAKANEPTLMVDQRMQLRDRKAKAPTGPQVAKATSKTDRRRTIAAVGDLPVPDGVERGKSSTDSVGLAMKRARRRSSASSSILSAFETMNLNDDSGSTSNISALEHDGKVACTQDGLRKSSLPTKASTAPVQRKLKPAAAPNSSTGRTKTSSKKKADLTLLSNNAANDGNGSNGDWTHLGPSNRSPKFQRKADADLDAILAGGKKTRIRLKVPTPEENAAREQKMADERGKQKKYGASKKPASARPTKAAVAEKTVAASGTPSALSPTASKLSNSIDSEKPMTPVAVDLVSEVVRPGEQQYTEASSHDLPSTDSSVREVNTVYAEAPAQATIPAPAPAPMEMIATPFDEFRSPQVSLPGTSMVPTSGDSQTLANPDVGSSIPSIPPPETNAPDPRIFAPGAVKRTRADLPQFSATSAIPFARTEANPHPAKPAEAPKSCSVEAEARSNGIVFLPTSYNGGQVDKGRQDINGDAPMADATPSTWPAHSFPDNKGPEQQKQKQDEAQRHEQSQRLQSIWDVPETPPTLPHP